MIDTAAKIDIKRSLGLILGDGFARGQIIIERIEEVSQRVRVPLVDKFWLHLSFEEALVYIQVGFFQASPLSMRALGLIENLKVRPCARVVPQAPLVTHRLDNLHPFLFHVVGFAELVFQALLNIRFQA